MWLGSMQKEFAVSPTTLDGWVGAVQAAPVGVLVQVLDTSKSSWRSGGGISCVAPLAGQSSSVRQQPLGDGVVDLPRYLGRIEFLEDGRDIRAAAGGRRRPDP